jgi:Spy/CpxP family protein refolding chaperone
MIRRIALCLLFTAPISLALSAPAAFADKDKVKDPAKLSAKRAKLHAKIAELRSRRLFEVLGVDQAGKDKVAALLDRYDQKLLPLREQMGASRRELKLLLQNGSFDDARANRLVDAIGNAQAEIHRLERERLGELRRLLTPRQMAVAVVRLPEIERSIEAKLRKIAKAQARAGGQTWPRGDGDDD